VAAPYETPSLILSSSPTLMKIMGPIYVEVKLTGGNPVIYGMASNSYLRNQALL